MLQTAPRRACCHPRAIDAHCHLHDPRLRAHVAGVVERAWAANVTHVVACGCHESDWSTLEAFMGEGDAAFTPLAQGRLKVIPAFGMHPWWADGPPGDGYLDRLRAKLSAHPRAMLGEIGLCKSARGKQVPMATQERVFREQLELATEMQRPCVIHCVGAAGKLLEILQSENKSSALPPVVILHSYSGAAEMIPSFLALEKRTRQSSKFFFSFNAKQLTSTARNGQGSIQKLSKAEKCCRIAPLDSLLFETDAPDQIPAISLEDESSIFQDCCPEGLNEPALVHLALRRAAVIREMPVEEFAEVIYQNSLRAFNISMN